jgi:hypothetical protein
MRLLDVSRSMQPFKSDKEGSVDHNAFLFLSMAASSHLMYACMTLEDRVTPSLFISRAVSHDLAPERQAMGAGQGLRTDIAPWCSYCEFYITALGLASFTTSPVPVVMRYLALGIRPATSRKHLP